MVLLNRDVDGLDVHTEAYHKQTPSATFRECTNEHLTNTVLAILWPDGSMIADAMTYAPPKLCIDCHEPIHIPADRCVSCSAKRGNFFVRNPKSPNQMTGDKPWFASVQEDVK